MKNCLKRLFFPAIVRKYILAQVLLTTLPILIFGLWLSVNQFQHGFEIINQVNGQLHAVFETKVNDLENEVWQLTDTNFRQASKIEEYSADLKNREPKSTLEHHSIELRSNIINGAVPLSQKIVASLSGIPDLNAARIQAILQEIFNDRALFLFFWESRQEIADTVQKHAFTRDFGQYAEEVFTAGRADWFEDELGTKDIAASLIPLQRNGHLEGVYCLVFDLSESYSQLDNALRLGLSLESSRLQEQRLQKAENHKKQLLTRREQQQTLLAENKSLTMRAIFEARNRLMLFMGATMILLMTLSLFLFWWLGTRRISLLKNWLANITEGNLSAGPAVGAAGDTNPGPANDRQNTTAADSAIPAGLQSQRVDVHTDDEMGKLGKSINFMLDSLAQTTVSKNLLIREVEERKKIENRLWDNQQRLNTIFNAVPAGVVLIDAERHVIVELNPAAEQMIGADSREIVGRTCHNFICPAEQHGCPIDDLGQQIKNSQKILLTADGGELPIIKTETEITLDGKRHFIASFVDITDLQQARRELEEATRAAEHASAVKSQFLANMSHEIRTPLNGVIGMTNLALDNDLPDALHTILSTIGSEGQSLLRIINDILDFSKMEAGKMDIETVAFDLCALCEEVVQSIIYAGKHKGLEIRFAIAPHIPPLLQGDPGRIRQVLKNLCGNALKFTHRGEIVVTVDLQEDYGDGVSLLFSIRDTGIGIAPEKLGIIFDSFTQADGTTTRLFGGTGLGTAISKQLVELMGGEISVESELGKGSIFRFLLPFLKSATPDRPRPVLRQKLEKTVGTALAMGQGKTADRSTGQMPAHEIPNNAATQYCILLVEDYPTNQIVVRNYLTKAGFTVDLAENGHQAVVLFQQKAYDLVLMDIQMPIMDGYGATREIRKYENNNSSGRKTPIIAMTAHATSGYREKCLAGGMDDFVSKPIIRKDFLEIIQRWLPPDQNTGKQLPDTPVNGIETSDDAPVDIKKLLEVMRGDEEIIRTLFDIFTEDLTAQKLLLQQAVTTGDCQTIRNEAHSIKGAALNVAAFKLHATAKQLEEIGARAAGDELLPAFNQFVSEIDTFIRFAKTYKGTQHELSSQ